MTAPTDPDPPPRRWRLDLPTLALAVVGVFAAVLGVMMEKDLAGANTSGQQAAVGMVFIARFLGLAVAGGSLYLLAGGGRSD